MSAIDTDSSHSLAVLADGTVWGWGLNDTGQLGTGSAEPWHPNTPVRSRLF